MLEDPPPIGDDADVAPGPTAGAGEDTITWTYQVTNTGALPIPTVVVSDDNGTPGDTNDDFNPAPVEEDGFNTGGTNQDGALDLGEVWLYRASAPAELGQNENVGIVEGFPTTGSSVTDFDLSHYFGIVPTTDRCDVLGKAAVLTMKFGDGTALTTHSQDPSKVVITNSIAPPYAPSVGSPIFITVSSKEDLSDSKAKIYLTDFEITALGQTFEIDASVVGKTRLESTTYVLVHDSSGNLLQTILFHTSCSQPLVLGDQFGSVELVGFTGE